MALNNTVGNEPVSPRPRYRIRQRRSALAVAQEDAFIPTTRRHPHRPPGIQVHVPDHDHADCERGRIAIRLAAAALDWK
jgi:hypothetical protein